MKWQWHDEGFLFLCISVRCAAPPPHNFQAYLHSTVARLACDLERAHMGGYVLGAKLVRGEAAACLETFTCFANAAVAKYSTVMDRRMWLQQQHMQK